MDIKDFPLPKNIDEMRLLLEQFAPFISQEKYQLFRSDAYSRIHKLVD